MITFKKGVKLEGVTQKCVSAMSVAAIYFDLYLDRDLVVTSVTDGKHKNGSKHYEGNAFDLRTWKTPTCGVQMSAETKGSIATALAERLGIDYDVVVEGTHIHVEYDPQS